MSFLNRLGRNNAANSNGQQQQQQQHYSAQQQQQPGRSGYGPARKSPTLNQYADMQPEPAYGSNNSAGHYGNGTNKPLYLCQPFVKAALIKGSFKTITAQPKYVDAMEWVAVNSVSSPSKTFYFAVKTDFEMEIVVDFFHNLNHFLGVVSEHCTRDTCPTMSAGPGMDYTWTSGPNKKQVKVPATEYTDYVLTWAEKTIGDEAIFPTKAGREFSPSFPTTAKHLYTQFLRIFAHLYHAHFHQILHLSLEGHLNSLFAHFLVFGMTFGLLDMKETRAPREGWGFVVGDLMDVWGQMGILQI